MKLEDRLAQIDAETHCSPTCRPSCAGCTPDGFWAQHAQKKLEEALAEVEVLRAKVARIRLAAL